MTNRLGRVIDRSRILAEGLGAAADADRPLVIAQLRILSARARLVRRAIALATFSVLLAALLIITLFAGVMLELAITGVLIGLFVLCMLALIVSLLYFLSDVNLTLRALWLEIPAEGREPA
jgi:hypothetical protein